MSKQVTTKQVAQVAQAVQASGKQTTTKQAVAATTPAVVAATPAVVAATPAKGKKEQVVAAPAAVVQAAPAPAVPVVQAVEQDGGAAADSGESSLNVQYLELQTQVSSAQDMLTALKNNLKRFHKVAERQIAKLSKNKRHHNQNRTPTGFGKARAVPAAIITLLGLESGAEMTRPDVTKKLYEYIDSNKLRSDEDKRIIRVNDGLTNAFKLTKDQVKSINASKSEKDANGLNFYNIQKFVAKLYQETDETAVKKVVVQEEVVAAATDAKTKKVASK
jgi:hypothetical protein